MVIPTSLVVCITSDAISSEPRFARATEAALQVLAESVRVAIVLTAGTLVVIFTSVRVKVVDVTRLAALTVTIDTVGTAGTGSGTAVG